MHRIALGRLSVLATSRASVSRAIAPRNANAFVGRAGYSATASTPKVEEADKAATPEPDLSLNDAAAQETPKTPAVDIHEKIKSDTVQQQSFQAETRRLLDIVTHSLYSEREVFVRELCANASDALEKLRHTQLMGGVDDAVSKDPLEIRISVDKEKGLFVIQDNGIGMDREELIKNLGTIAQSGTDAFRKTLDKAASSTSAANNIIGKFGVGFYASFMVADRVQVFTKSAKTDSVGLCWESTGDGTYTIAEADGVDVGTKIVLHLRKDSLKYAEAWEIENILQKYSNFLGFPIFLNKDRVNTIEPLWTKDKSSVTKEDHVTFYRFIAKAWDEPQFTLHYKTDAPLSIAALLYVPERHTEFAGMGRMETGVSLYSRKVLIQPKAKQLLPEWLRFLKGAVDSEDIPLNISRELLQNGALINKLKRVLTTRVIKWLEEESRRDAPKFNSFFKDFGIFLKEGVCTDRDNKDDIGKLLRYETSKSAELSTFKDYVSRMKENQKNVYFVVASSREAALDSPYLETFQKKDVEVLFCYETVDEFVMTHLQAIQGKTLINIENAKEEDLAEIDQLENVDAKDHDAPKTGVDLKSLTDADKAELVNWFKKTLGKKLVSDVTISKRQISAPALIVGHDSAVMRRLMQMTPGFKDLGAELPQKLEINPDHPLIRGMFYLRDRNESLCRNLALQVYDNACLGANLMDDPRRMLRRLSGVLGDLVAMSSGTHSDEEVEKKDVKVGEVVMDENDTTSKAV